jgi:hypothetical protein
MFETSEHDQFQELSTPFQLGGFAAEVRRHDHFYELRVTEFSSREKALAFALVVQVAMIELRATKGVALWVHPLSPIDRNESPMNVTLRDGFAQQQHPAWDRRLDGSVTDGGVFPNQSCILPEHERIWEYPILWAKPVRQWGAESLKEAVATASRISGIDSLASDVRLQAASKFLSFGNAEANREIGFVLYATVLEILADENGQAGVGQVVAECHRFSGEKVNEVEGSELYRIRNKLVHEGVGRLDGRLLSWDEFSERYWRIRALAGQGVHARFRKLSSGQAISE